MMHAGIKYFILTETGKCGFICKNFDIEIFLSVSPPIRILCHLYCLSHTLGISSFFKVSKSFEITDKALSAESI